MSVGFGRIKFVLEEEGGGGWGGSFPEHGVVCYLCGVHGDGAIKEWRRPLEESIIYSSHHHASKGSKKASDIS